MRITSCCCSTYSRTVVITELFVTEGLRLRQRLHHTNRYPSNRKKKFCYCHKVAQDSIVGIGSQEVYCKMSHNHFITTFATKPSNMICF